MFTFQVTPEGGEEYEVTATSRDVYVWEKAGRGRTLSRLLEEQSVGDLYAIAHIASRRQQLFDGSLSDFTEACDIESREDGTDDPTQPDR